LEFYTTSTTSRSYNALPHNYGYSFHNKNPTPYFHAEIGGLTRSGRCFTPEELRNHSQSFNVVEIVMMDEVNKLVSDAKAIEFLKLMKHSKYDVVDQLKKTLTRISLLPLVLSLELHRNAL
jgi:hypothetical protein